MYPPKISDRQILSVIEELSTSANLPSGASLRAALASRFGSRGGVSRVYALLEQARRQRRATPEFATEPAREEVVLLRAQLALAREREESDQRRWAEEVDRLRIKVAALEPLAHQSQRLRETADLLQRRLQAAESLAGRLEAELLIALQSAQRSPPP